MQTLALCLEYCASTHTARGRRRRRWCGRSQKRGKRGGILARLKASPLQPALPTILLGNVRSLYKQLDHLRLRRTTRHEIRDCCAFVFTETWLNDNTPDSAVQLDALCLHRANRNTLSGKSQGGGLCVYTNTAWCQDAVVVSKHCSAVAEFLFIKCRPYYLPREYTSVFIVAVYIPPIANAKEALSELHDAICKQQTKHPEAFFIVLGDLNHTNLKTVLQRFHQHILFATRGENTLDKAYTTLKGTYKASPLRHLGSSDHISVMLIPAYRPQVKLLRPVKKQVRVWSEESISALQDCMEITDWNIFREAATFNDHTDLQEYTMTVLDYSPNVWTTPPPPKQSLCTPTRNHG